MAGTEEAIFSSADHGVLAAELDTRRVSELLMPIGTIGCTRSFDGAGASEGASIAAAEADMDLEHDVHFGRSN